MTSPSDPTLVYPPPDQENPILAEVVPTDTAEIRPHQIPLVPIVLFLITCYTTYRVEGVAYAACVLGILLCHEFGHYLQARRYHVPASLPYFIPVPFGPFGTMGAVIGMRGHMGNRKALFDIGISGPLAGLVPAILCCVVGLQRSSFVDVSLAPDDETIVGAPLLFLWLMDWTVGPMPAGKMLHFHPIAYAGWVGLFVTALNLIPIGQLDGGHILYAILRKKAHIVATLLLSLAIATMLITGNLSYMFMLLLLLWIGPNHPPTADDEMPLGLGRTVLGWATLAFILIGFTATPIVRM